MKENMYLGAQGKDTTTRRGGLILLHSRTLLGVVGLGVHHTLFEVGSSWCLDVDVNRVNVDNLTWGRVRSHFPFGGGLVPIGVMIGPNPVGLPMVLAITKPWMVLLHEQNELVSDFEVDLLSTCRGGGESIPEELGPEMSRVPFGLGDRLAMLILHIARESRWLLLFGWLRGRQGLVVF